MALYPTCPHNEDGWSDSSYCDQCCGWAQPCLSGTGECLVLCLIICVQVGDLMLVKDHINMFGLAAESPLRGPNDESFGPRFFSINDLYNKKWRNIAKAAAEEVKYTHVI